MYNVENIKKNNDNYGFQNEVNDEKFNFEAFKVWGQ